MTWMIKYVENSHLKGRKMEKIIILQNFLPKNLHPNKSMVIYPNYFLLIFFLSFLVSIAFGQKEKDEDRLIIERSVNFNENGTVNSVNVTTLNVTGINGNGTVNSVNGTTLNGTGLNENGTVNSMNGTALNGTGFNENGTVNSMNGSILNTTGFNENGTVNSVNETTLNTTGFNGNGTVNSVNETALNGTDSTENGTINSMNGTTLNTTGFNLNETEWNETLKALNDSFQQTFQPIMMTTTKMPRQIPLGPKLYNDSQVDSKWKIRMVHNLRWDLSKNFLAVSYLNLQSQTYYVDGIAAISVIGEHYYPRSRMSFFYGIDQPNMLIRFNQTQNGAAFCEFGQLKESVVRKTQKQLNVWEWENCVYQRNPIYNDEVDLPMKTQLYAFCPIPSDIDGSPVFKWRLANGTYNPPSKTPHCIYDFHRKATEPEEYHLLKYCSKAYFFNGLDYNMPNKRMRNRRKDWLLYLAEGQLKCSISGDIQTDMDLVGKGYTVELIQFSMPRIIMGHYDNEDPIRTAIYSKKCPILYATLVSYKDQMKEGKFIFSAVVGSAQLDGDLRKPYEKENARFWDKKTYNEKFKYMNFEDKSCYIFYQSFLRDHTNRYLLNLRVSHFCTERGMRGNLDFYIPIGPDQVKLFLKKMEKIVLHEQVPEEGIYEDTGLQIDLFKGELTRSTGQILKAKNLEKPATQEVNPTNKPDGQQLIKSFAHWFGTPSEDSPKVSSSTPSSKPANNTFYIIDNISLPEYSNCNHTYQCSYGYRCGNKGQQTFCYKTYSVESIAARVMCGDQLNDYYKKSEDTNIPDWFYNSAKWINTNVCPDFICQNDFNTLKNHEIIDTTQRCISAENSPTRIGSGPNNQGIYCRFDHQCRIDEFCAFQNGECRKFHFKLPGEKCYLDGECLPGLLCDMHFGLYRWGKCQYPTYVYNQQAWEPNDPLD